MGENFVALLVRIGQITESPCLFIPTLVPSTAKQSCSNNFTSYPSHFTSCPRHCRSYPVMKPSCPCYLTSYPAHLVKFQCGVSLQIREKGENVQPN